MPLKVDGDALSDELQQFQDRVLVAVRMYAETKAKQIEAYAKANRPWTDRTGQAKANLRCVVTQPNSSSVRITLAHGVDYGVWLELANEQNYAIVIPTIRKYGPEVMNGFSGLLNKLKG